MDIAKLFRLDGRVALVTGGSRNIGAWIAEAFIAQGAKVYISARKADACFAMAEKLGPNCIALPQDVSTVAGCKALAAQFAEHEHSRQCQALTFRFSIHRPATDAPQELTVIQIRPRVIRLHRFENIAISRERRQVQVIEGEIFQ